MLVAVIIPNFMTRVFSFAAFGELRRDNIPIPCQVKLEESECTMYLRRP